MEEGEKGFTECAVKCGLVERNRWCLYRLFMMKENDIVVVPLYEQVFAVIRLRAAKPISNLPVSTMKSVSGRDVVLNDVLEYQDDASLVDLGFLFHLIRNLYP